ncbi:MAG TPA: alpha/beta fold hydrolase [Ktedonobacterales bacterium]
MQVPQPAFVTLSDGRKLAYDEVSPPNPQDAKGTILLLTGLGSKRLGWMRQMEAFGREYRTLALDHRDTGDSDEVEVPYTVADLADDASTLLSALGIARANVVGISLGGFVALQLAVHHPEQIDKLVLVSTSAGGATHVNPSPEVAALLAPDTNLEIGERAVRNYSAIMAAQYVQAHPEELERIAETARYRPMSQGAYMRQLQAALAHDVTSELQSIRMPTLVIHGEVDPLVPPPNGAYLAGAIPGARHMVYPGVGHIPIVERADDFNRDVLAFLGGELGEGNTEADANSSAAESLNAGQATQAQAENQPASQSQPLDQPLDQPPSQAPSDTPTPAAELQPAVAPPAATDTDAKPSGGRGPFPFIWRNRKRERKLTGD